MSLTIDRAQRTALFLELDHHDLRDLPEIKIAFTQQRYDDAQRLRWDYEAARPRARAARGPRR